MTGGGAAAGPSAGVWAQPARAKQSPQISAEALARRNPFRMRPSLRFSDIVVVAMDVASLVIAPWLVVGFSAGHFGRSITRGRWGDRIGRGRLRRRRLHDQHGAGAIAHDLFGLAPPEEPADAAT